MRGFTAAAIDSCGSWKRCGPKKVVRRSAACTPSTQEQDLEFDPADALEAVGLDRGFSVAADDASWDAAVRRETEAGLALTGNDVGTPLIGFDDSDGNPVGFFGPVISRSVEAEAPPRPPASGN